MSKCAKKGGCLEKRRINFDVSEEEHQKLKMLAVAEKKSLKSLFFTAIDKAFPNWRNVNPKLDLHKNEKTGK